MTEKSPEDRAPPAQIASYVEVLGADLTVEFLLVFGGAELHLADDPKGRSRLEGLVGYRHAKALGQIQHKLQRRVPLAKPWIAANLHARGHSVAEIARRLHASDVSVRNWLNPKQAPS